MRAGSARAGEETAHAAGRDGAAASVAARALHMMGPETRAVWQADEAMAWEGLLEVTRRLRRGAEELLLERFELSISMLGVIGRLALAEAHTSRQTALADSMGLSLSRTSRVIDLLEHRELVERRECQSDARATNVTLTRRGAALTAKAQRELLAFVQRMFIDTLSATEVKTLAAVFARVIDDAAPSHEAAAEPGDDCR